METLDRKTAPRSEVVEKTNMIQANEYRMANNIPVYSINAGTQDLVKIEFIFEAGLCQQEKPLQAITANSMLEGGTSRLTAAQIADKVDYYGAFLETSITHYSASVTLYTLNKHLTSTLPVVEQIIKDSIFPKHELDTFLINRKQRFLVNNEKVDFVARKHFLDLLYGEKHPYGSIVKESDFDSVEQVNLLSFYSKQYSSTNCKIILSGKVNGAALSLIEKHFGGNDWSRNIEDITKQKIDLASISTSTEREHYIEKNGSVQSAIRIGKVLFDKTHQDFQSLQILNTVFGGYFGSRLMSNIREDKGYTYGIGSGLVSLKGSGYFFISTEVGVEVCQPAIDEIYGEMGRLREELIKEEELSLVKNYLLGSFLRSVDGPFALAERFKGIMEFDLDYDYFDKYIATIKEIKASKLRDLANQYFDKDSMINLVVGKK